MLADADLGHLDRGLAVGPGGVAGLGRIQPATIAMIATRKIRSPTNHMIPAASRWSSSGVGPHGGPASRSAGRARPDEQDHDREERVLRHLQEHVHEPPGWPIRHGAGSSADRRPPEEQRAAEEDGVLEVVDERVLERRVEQRREVRHPHHDGEDQPGDDREASTRITREWRTGRIQRRRRGR